MNGIGTLISFNAILIPSVAAPEGEELRYTTLPFYKQVPNSVNADFLFAVVHNHEPVMEVLYLYYNIYILYIYEDKLRH